MIVGRSTLDCHEIDLASAGLLPTTSLRLAIINASTSSRWIAAAARTECPDASDASVRNCDKRKYGDAAHSRFAGQEHDLICNHKFV